MSKRIPKKINKISPKSSDGMFCVTENDFNRNGSQAVLLYRFVYSNTISYLACLFLLTSFLFQGIDFAYASEVVTEDTQSQDVTIIKDSYLEQTEESVDEIIFGNNDIDPGQDISVPEESIEDEAIGVGTDLVEVNEDSSDYDSQDISVLEEDSETESIDGETDTVEEDDVILTEEDLLENTTETVSVVQSDSAFSFTKNECTQLANGSFYCMKPQENVLKDALFAAPDEQGDLEIYFVKDGNQMQVTDNTEDDASPFYDQNTNFIVWHRLINDRYQIVLYDIESGTEEVLTNTNSNNMEPNKQGDYIVWQRWVDGTWNIVFYDGKSEKQITTASGNNVAPYIHGSLIVWNRHSVDGIKTIEIYDIDSRTYVTVEDPDGLSVSNPRMVFVYDSLSPNGDVVTKGYDLLAKKFIDLDTLPKELPDEIPSSDSTGETRALIQSKPLSKSELEEALTASSTGMVSGNNDLNTNATSTEAASTSASLQNQSVQAEVINDLMTLDLSNLATSSTPEIGNHNTDLADFDIVVDLYQPEIEDNSIVEFVEPVQEL